MRPVEPVGAAEERARGRTLYPPGRQIFAALDATRVAALLSGDVDAIEQPPTADLARLKSDPKFAVSSKISHRVIYFNFDHQSRQSPFITAKDGRTAASTASTPART